MSNVGLQEQNEPTGITPSLSIFNASFLAGGGTMGALMRTFDWTQSPLGPLEHWPQSLRTAISLALSSQFPTVLFCGSDFVLLYNDAYLPILADKHPASVGRPVREVFPETWSLIEPMLQSVLNTGQATWSSDLLLPIIHHGVLADHYFTFSYTPIWDENGRVCGIFCPVTETTEPRQSEQRERLLRLEAEAAREQMSHILETMDEGFFVCDREWRITAVNAAAVQLMNQRREDLIGKHYAEVLPGIFDTVGGRELRRAMTERVAVEVEEYYPPFDRWYEARVCPLNDERLSVFFRDITERKQAEEEREILYQVAQDLVRAADLNTISDCILSWTQRLFRADYVDLMLADPGSLALKGVANTLDKGQFHHEQIDIHTELSLVTEVFQQRRVVVVDDFTQSPFISERLRQAYNFLRTTCGVPLLSGGQPVGVLCMGYHTRKEMLPDKLRLLQLLGDELALAVERIRLTDALQESEQYLRLATDSAEVGIWHFYPQKDRLIWSPQFKRLFGLTPDDAELTYQQFLSYVHPEDRQRMDQPIKQVLEEGKELDVEYRIVWPDGSVHWIGAKGRAFHDGPEGTVWFRGVALDITTRKQAEEGQTRQAEELRHVNAELQQFAYVASHDLQEPLRTVASFAQLLARRYQGRLDAKANEFIDHIVNSATRMQTLIQDLLTYARVEREEKAFTATDSDAVLKRTIDALQVTIEQSGAQLTHDLLLPTVWADESQLGQVFQNLISNALKFRGPESPHVHISARHEGPQWVFAVRDNGIGLDPQYADRIFQVFQRLHTRQEYPGTGIGLAVCKKIIERHNGRIWVESTLGQGATFIFTIPAIS